MADIFISYTSSDRDWAFWIAKELEALGHAPHIHEWEIKGGDDIYAWMEQRHDAADHVLCVISDEYLKAPYSTLERNAALWQAASKRPGFVLLVQVKTCALPTLSDHMRRCKLFGVSEEAARIRFREFVEKRQVEVVVGFPGTVCAVSNIPIRVPTHFMGREDTLAAIKTELHRELGRVAITALHGLRGVGKTTLAAAYAERHQGAYRATWWIRAQTESSIRADLVALGVRLGWIAADEKEEPAIAAVIERLRHEGEGILLIFDSVPDASALKLYLPRGGRAQVLVTSNAHAWRSVATPIEIELWPVEIGADYLLMRTGRAAEREAASILSELLGGLPLAHEQAAAYCERLDISLATYSQRFELAPARLLDSQRDAPTEYHDRLTVAKTFALAIEQAGKFHPAADSLLVHAALLAPEPIPLFLFAEAREQFGEPLGSALADDGLDDVLAALRAFALIERETVADERDPAVTTDCIRLHRLVRRVARTRYENNAREEARRALVWAMAAVYPWDDFNRNAWPRARRLDGLGLALVGDGAELPKGAEAQAAYVIDGLARFRQVVLGSYAQARPLFELALAIREKVFGPEHPETATSCNNLANSLFDQGDLARARPLLERALAIRERVVGPEHSETATNLNNLAILLHSQGDLISAQALYQRALTIREKVLGSEHPDTASSLNSLAVLLQDQGDPAGARALHERALAIRERVLGPEHPQTATSLDNLAVLLQAQGDLGLAGPLHERALAIREKVFGPEHPEAVTNLYNLARLRYARGDLTGARSLLERALRICEGTMGVEHPLTASNLNNLAVLLHDQGDIAEAGALQERALAIREKVLGPEHPQTATSLGNLAVLLQAQGDLAGARALQERALAIREKVLGPEHSDTATSLGNLAVLLQAQGDLAGARPLYERALAIREKVLDPEHPDTVASLNNLAALLKDQGDFGEARSLYERVLANAEKSLRPEYRTTARTLDDLTVLILGGAIQTDADLAEARSLYERALIIHEKALGLGGLSTKLNSLSGMPSIRNDHAEMRRLCERAVLVSEKVIGPEHPHTQRYRSHLAQLLLENGNLDEALNIAKTALETHETVLGVTHPWSKASAHVAENTLDALGRADEAARLRARYGIE